MSSSDTDTGDELTPRKANGKAKKTSPPQDEDPERVQAVKGLASTPFTGYADDCPIPLRSALVDIIKAFRKHDPPFHEFRKMQLNTKKMNTKAYDESMNNLSFECWPRYKPLTSHLSIADMQTIVHRVREMVGRFLKLHAPADIPEEDDEDALYNHLLRFSQETGLPTTADEFWHILVNSVTPLEEAPLTQVPDADSSQVPATQVSASPQVEDLVSSDEEEDEKPQLMALKKIVAFPLCEYWSLKSPLSCASYVSRCLRLISKGEAPFDGLGSVSFEKDKDEETRLSEVRENLNLGNMNPVEIANSISSFAPGLLGRTLRNLQECLCNLLRERCKKSKKGFSSDVNLSLAAFCASSPDVEDAQSFLNAIHTSCNRAAFNEEMKEEMTLQLRKIVYGEDSAEPTKRRLEFEDVEDERDGKRQKLDSFTPPKAIAKEANKEPGGAENGEACASSSSSTDVVPEERPLWQGFLAIAFGDMLTALKNGTGRKQPERMLSILQQGMWHFQNGYFKYFQDEAMWITTFGSLPEYRRVEPKVLGEMIDKTLGDWRVSMAEAYVGAIAEKDVQDGPAFVAWTQRLRSHTASQSAEMSQLAKGVVMWLSSVMALAKTDNMPDLAEVAFHNAVLLALL